ncbi:MAG: hypothetical protein WC789_09125 [Lentisphaeria bacterium]|jgi:hypothetical protein
MITTMMKPFRLLVQLAGVAALAGSAGAAAIATWNFNDQNLIVNAGAGTASYVGGTKASSSGEFASGVDGSDDHGWNTSSYPAQGTADQTAGVQFTVGTHGYTGIALSSDLLASAFLVAVLVLVIVIAVRVFQVPDRSNPIAITTTVRPSPTDNDNESANSSAVQSANFS